MQNLQAAAAYHQDNMKQEVNKSTDNYLEISQAAAQMSEFGYCTGVREQLLQLVSRIGEGNYDVGNDDNDADNDNDGDDY